MKYELNDKPGLLPMLMYGLQWWIVSLPCVVIMGIIVSKLHYTDVAEQTFYLQVVRDHGRGDGRASVVGASVAVGYRSGIRVVDWDSCYCFSGNFRHIHGDSGRGAGVDGIGVQWLVGKITVYFHASRCHGHSDIDCFHVDSR